MRIRQLIRTSAEYIVERFERAPEYPFINTKFHIAADRDFSDGDEPFRQRGYIYSWIQGRGLESLADHVRFFRDSDPGFALKLQTMARKVMTSTESMRRANGGRLAFAMTPDGKSCFEPVGSAGNYSDLFYSKGLFAAAVMLDDRAAAADAEALFRFVLDEIINDRFQTDQHGFDPKNPVRFVPGKLIQGPRMIALSALARFAAAQPDDPFYLQCAADIIRYICTHHINTGTRSQLQMFDFAEAVDPDHNLWFDGSSIVCDPGHALEFIGLAGKCLLQMRRTGTHADLIAECRRIFPPLFRHIFDLGWQPAGGIIKSFDLVSRTPLNSDMPWWSLPETVRAGKFISLLYPDDSDGIIPRITQAENAFFSGFVAAGSHGFACQTRSSSGSVIDVIPAVPDADPGYHTNCSFLDSYFFSREKK